MLSVYNQSYDVNTETAELRVICEKLQFLNVDDITQESLALQEMVVDKGGHSQKNIQDMSLLVLKKIQDFLVMESGNNIVSPSEDFSRHTDEPHLKLCSQSLVIPDEFCCPISLELMRSCYHLHRAGELRLLAKQNGQNRKLIAEAGAIPHLVDLLYAPDAGTQEHVVTALLNLSINVDNKERIMASEAVPGILHVLENGSMEARENAAATFFSLSGVDENRVAIGVSGAIPALVTLFCEGSQRGKVDAAKAPFNLCLSQGNKGRAIRAGIVPKLIEMLTELDGDMRDEALTIMAVVANHSDGQAAIGSMNVVSTLVELVSNGSPRNKENATSVLLLLCNGDPFYLSIVSSLGVVNPLLYLAENGSERAKRKASQLLELIGNH